MAIPVIASLISSVAPTVAGAITSAVSKPADRLGKDDFLKLLVAQLRNQNPLNPLANDQFIQQSAQFSSLEELQNIRKGVEGLSAGSSQTLGNAAALVGRSVSATAGRFAFTGNAVSLPFTLKTPLSNGMLEVADASGTVVARQALGARGAGQHNAVFNTPSGRILAAGEYRYRIVSMDGGQGTALPAIAGSVTGITVADGQPVLQIGSVTVGLSDVTTIGTPTN